MDLLYNYTIPPFSVNGIELNKDIWENIRRPEIMRLFSENLYGKTPDKIPDTVFYEIAEDNPIDRGGKNHFRKIWISMYFGNEEIKLEVHSWTPFGNGPFPVQLMVDPFEYALMANRDFSYRYSRFPSDYITDRGYAAVKVLTSTICMDNEREYRKGIIECLSSDLETDNQYEWGAIGAWAWATSRCIDYLETQSYYDTSKIAISGCSRAGKTALWCAAQDSRIAVVMSNVSGTFGSAILRGKNGEHIEDGFPFWYCKKLREYLHNEDALPIDGHMLLAMAAPRPLYMASATDDIWADNDAEYKSLFLCSEIYRLYYPDIFLPDHKPAPNTQLHIGSIGYHLRKGKHGLTYYDWNHFMDFCDCYLM